MRFLTTLQKFQNLTEYRFKSMVKSFFFKFEHTVRVTSDLEVDICFVALTQPG